MGFISKNNSKASPKNPSKNLFLHVDGDAFFVACELTLHPELRGKAVIVGGDRGIAVAMSMEAKALGVTRGMPVFQIKKNFPQVVILSHHFDLYTDIAERLHRILESYFQTIEVYSIDECFALVEPSEIKYFGLPRLGKAGGEKKLLTELKKEIEQTLGVTYSIGLARTKVLAKQASKLEKPGGLVMLLTKADEVRALKLTPIDKVWGIGRQTVPRLLRLKINTAYDFVNYSDAYIEKNFSEPLLNLKKELGGEQILGVEGNADPRDQKSIQATSTFRPASDDPKTIWGEIAKNSERACENAREIHLVSNKISFFVKNSDFKYRVAEVKLPLYTADPGLILNAIEPKFPKLLLKKERIRSTGVILHNLVREENVQPDLFGKQDKAMKNLAIEEVADKIRKKYGDSAIKRVASMTRKK
jgi:nucleotidyltransferase/DNA polymerase involved in DNA repair